MLDDEYEDYETDNGGMTIGEFIRAEYMEEEEISAEELAFETGIDEEILNDILYHGDDIEPEDAYKLSEYFGLPDEYFLEKQQDLSHGRENDDFEENDEF